MVSKPKKLKVKQKLVEKTKPRTKEELMEEILERYQIKKRKFEDQVCRF